MRVGIAIDGSVYGNAAVKFVVRHRALFGANPRYSLIHVERKETGHPLQALLAYLPGAEFRVETARPNQQSAFEHTMRTPRRLFSRAGIEAQEVDLVGAAGDAIAKHAQRTLDLLVMGSHGHGLIWSAALDATTMHVASRCTIPLLLIRRP
jgi:nucleotide-binding universal stress UspA family protein